jgi:hypothetical protein
VIVTIPLGVLQLAGVTGAIEFDPPLDQRIRAATKLVMGRVMRVVLQLDPLSGRRSRSRTSATIDSTPCRSCNQ